MKTERKRLEWHNYDTAENPNLSLWCEGGDMQ